MLTWRLDLFSQRKISFLISLIFVILELLMCTCSMLSIPSAKAASAWSQTSDTDFTGGILNNLIIKGNGIDGYLKIKGMDLNSWEQMTPSTHPQGSYWGAMATVYKDNQVMLFSGVGEYGPWLYNLSTNLWVEKTSSIMPTMRYWHSMASIGNDDKT
jgi:hypothetical protein